MSMAINLDKIEAELDRLTERTLAVCRNADQYIAIMKAIESSRNHPKPPGGSVFHIHPDEGWIFRTPEDCERVYIRVEMVPAGDPWRPYIAAMAYIGWIEEIDRLKADMDYCCGDAWMERNPDKTWDDACDEWLKFRSAMDAAYKASDEWRFWGKVQA